MSIEIPKLNSYKNCQFEVDIWHTLETLERTTTEIETQLERFCEEIKELRKKIHGSIWNTAIEYKLVGESEIITLQIELKDKEKRARYLQSTLEGLRSVMYYYRAGAIDGETGLTC